MNKPNKTERPQENNQKGNKKIRWGKILMVVFTVFVLLQFGQQYIKYTEVNSEIAVYEDKLEVAEAKYEDLKQEKSLLLSDSYIEKMAREDLGMIKKGEVLLSPAEEKEIPTLAKDLNESEMNH